MLCLAGSIVYFATTISKINRDVPEHLAKIENIAGRLDAVVEKLEDVRKLIPTVTRESQEIRQQVPLILDEVSAIRQQIPLVLTEVRETRDQIPRVLAESERIRKMVPSVLDEVKNTREVIPSILSRVDKVSEQVPLVLDEVAKTREAVPPMLSQAEQIVTDARGLGQETSEGAVTGLITGALKAPFKVVGSIGKTLFGVSAGSRDQLQADDMGEIKQAMNEVLVAGRINQVAAWRNERTGSRGTVKLIGTTVVEERVCCILHFEVVPAKGKRISRDVTFCRDDDKGWSPIEESSNP